LALAAEGTTVKNSANSIYLIERFMM
jgi:hypothetical protein